MAFDVAERERTEAGLQKMLGEGPIQIVVNNAGIHDDARCRHAAEQCPG